TELAAVDSPVRCETAIRGLEIMLNARGVAQAMTFFKKNNIDTFIHQLQAMSRSNDPRLTARSRDLLARLLFARPLRRTPHDRKREIVYGSAYDVLAGGGTLVDTTVASAEGTHTGMSGSFKFMVEKTIIGKPKKHLFVPCFWVYPGETGLENG